MIKNRKMKKRNNEKLQWKEKRKRKVLKKRNKNRGKDGRDEQQKAIKENLY